MELQSKAVKPWQFQPGQSGNPAGKPPGARHRFSRAFLEDLAEVWSEHGHKAMTIAAKTVPATFFAVCARLIPADVKVSIEQSFAGLDPTD